MDSPQQSGSWHSSYGRRAAQLCHCETLPVQLTKRCSHPAHRGKTEGQTERWREEGELIDPRAEP